MQGHLPTIKKQPDLERTKTQIGFESITNLMFIRV